MDFAVPEISAADAAEHYRRGGAVLLDCREPEELALCRIDGALHIPMTEIEQRAGEVPRDREVIVFCHHGVRSYAVAEFLRRLGHPHVFSMAGGIDAWSLDVDPGVPRY